MTDRVAELIDFIRANINTASDAGLYERGHDITETSHATSAFVLIGVLGYLTHRAAKHVDAGMSLMFSDLLVVGSKHRFIKTHFNGEQAEETVFDVRTALPVDELGPHRQHLLEQGSIATAAVIEWFESDEPDEDALAERIPYLPRREDHFLLRAARSI